MHVHHDEHENKDNNDDGGPRRSNYPSTWHRSNLRLGRSPARYASALFTREYARWLHRFALRTGAAARVAYRNNELPRAPKKRPGARPEGSCRLWRLVGCVIAWLQLPIRARDLEDWVSAGIGGREGSDAESVDPNETVMTSQIARLSVSGRRSIDVPLLSSRCHVATRRTKRCRISCGYPHRVQRACVRVAWSCARGQNPLISARSP